MGPIQTSAKNENMSLDPVAEPAVVPRTRETDCLSRFDHGTRTVPRLADDYKYQASRTLTGATDDSVAGDLRS